MKYLILLVALLPSTVLAITKYEDCEVGGARPNTIDIGGCEEAPCTMKNGVIYYITVNITAECTSPRLTTRIFTFYDDVFTGEMENLPESLSNSCGYVQPNCPATEGEHLLFDIAFGLNQLTRAGKLTTEVGVQCDSGKWLGCASIPFEVEV